mmetsp:Transcript_91605/g.255108  ORF Transcript_91605/g.255108 Transcript_91605/m.255108 type:complete len:206 (+) Transcript_91605:375-992(+)
MGGFWPRHGGAQPPAIPALRVPAPPRPPRTRPHGAGGPCAALASTGGVAGPGGVPLRAGGAAGCMGELLAGCEPLLGGGLRSLRWRQEHCGAEGCLRRRRCPWPHRGPLALAAHFAHIPARSRRKAQGHRASSGGGESRRGRALGIGGSPGHAPAFRVAGPCRRRRGHRGSGLLGRRAGAPCRERRQRRRRLRGRSTAAGHGGAG